MQNQEKFAASEADPSSRRAWRRPLVALFVTVHMACVVVSAVPRPPTIDDAVLANPEVQAELDQTIEKIHAVAPWRATAEEQRRDLFDFVRSYSNAVDRGRNFVAGYLRFAGGEQNWNMFGGTPPRFPLVLLVEIRPRDATEYVVFQDLNWRTRDAADMNFRHRKVQANLAAPWWSGAWNDYARYWARRWTAAHPDRPPAAVRLSFVRLTTPSPEQVRAGDAERRPTVWPQVELELAP